MDILKMAGEKISGFYYELEDAYDMYSQPIVVIGPTQCGRQYAINQLCVSKGKVPYIISDIKSINELFGFMDKENNYQKSPLFTSYTTGQILCIRDLNSGTRKLFDLLASINNSNKMRFPVGDVEKGEGFRIIIVADSLPNEIKQIKDKFCIVNFDYDANLEKNICKDKELYEFLSFSRKVIKDNEIDAIITTQTFSNLNKMLEVQLIKESNIVAAIFSDLNFADKEVLIQSLEQKIPQNRFFMALKNSFL